VQAIAKREGQKMRIIFMGTPEFAVPSLNALVTAGHDIVAVYSQPPRPAGRGKGLNASPVQRRAETLGIDVMTPASLRDKATQAQFSGFCADIAVVAAYGLILPQAVLDAPKLGCINVHGSILPRWRGAAPVQRAILAGDRETGVTIMDMAAGLDTGDMRAIARTPIDNKTAGILTDEIAELGANLLVEVLAAPHLYPPVPQPDAGVTYAAKIDKSEARLDFLISAPQVERQIRAFAPKPGAFFEHGGERFRILAAKTQISKSAAPGTVIDDQLTIACNPGTIQPTLVQRAGKSAMTTAELLRGCPIPSGTRLA
jgi:methionyl-tRNA formyltransferase